MLGKYFLIWFSSPFSCHINRIHRSKKTSSNFFCPNSNLYLGNTDLGKAGNCKSKNDRRDLLPVLEDHSWSFLPVQVFSSSLFQDETDSGMKQLADSLPLSLFSFLFILQFLAALDHSLWWWCVCFKDNSTWNCKGGRSEGLKHSTTSQWMGGDRNSLNI